MKMLTCGYMVMVLLVGTGCQPLESDNSSTVDAIIMTKGRPVMAVDAATIDNVNIAGDLLTLKVSYPGGSEDHDFRIYGSRNFLESVPVQANVYLSHDAKGDKAGAFLQKEIVYDLSSLKQAYEKAYNTSHGKIRLRIHGPGATTHLRPMPLYEF